MKIEHMSMAELQSAIDRMKLEVEKRRTEEVAAVIAEIREKMERYGLGISDLGFTAAELASGRGGARSKPSGHDRRSIVVPKYRDPASGATWSGRGRMPRWMVEAVDGGRSREDFRIED